MRVSSKMGWSIFAALLAAVTLFVYSRKPHQAGTSVTEKLLVSEKTILSFKSGTSLDEVSRTYGPAMRLEFSVRAGSETYTLLNCLGPSDELSTSLLFRNGRFDKIIETPNPVMEWYPYEGTTASRVKSWNIDDQARIFQTIETAGLTPSEISSHFQPYDGRGSQPGNILPALIIVSIFGPNISSRYTEDQKQNFELLTRYSGCRATLGITGKQVDDIFGKPLRVWREKNGETARIFGTDEELEVPPMVAFTGLAVVIDAQDRVTAIYGDGFFNNDWKTKDGEGN